jgi:hypothetical protein
MARLGIFNVKLDASQIEELADSLGQFDADALGQRLVETVNDVADRTYDLARRSILSGINLDRDYLESRFEVVHATGKKPVAEIVTPVRGKSAFSNLSRYGAVRFMQPVKHPERAQGDPGRKFPVGQKAGVMAAEVTRGDVKSVGKKFVIPSIKDRSGNPIVFRGLGVPGTPKNPRDKGRRKTPRQAIEPVLGPSVYQLFRFTAGQIQERVMDDLESAVVEMARKEFEKALS